MPRKYRKKPVVVEAVHYTGNNKRTIKSFTADGYLNTTGVAQIYDYTEVIDILTLEGVMKLRPGDWLIKGVKGEFYPCDNEIFHQTYEKA